MATITNTTKGAIGVTPEHVIAAGASASVPDDVLVAAMNHPGVAALFKDGSLESDKRIPRGPVKANDEAEVTAKAAG
jgi:hypothetical protein